HGRRGAGRPDRHVAGPPRAHAGAGSRSRSNGTMKNVKVILREDLPNLGSAGEIVSVRAGYARNYLLPRGFAYEATAANVRQLEEETRRAEQRARREYLEARRRASALEDLSLTFKARAGEESKLFGSITA